MKKKIGIIVAMQEECEEILEIMEEVEQKRIYDLTFWIGKIEKVPSVLVKAGVGKVNAARVTQMMIDFFPMESIINLGAAGALDPKLQIGDIVLGEELVQHDFDITAFGHSKGYITGIGDRVFSNRELIKELQNIVEHQDELIYKIEVGVIASGDIFCTDVKMKDKIYAKFGAKCVEMEGAAVAQVCYLNQIPFVVIRSISDSPNGENVVTFEQFVELASKRCANLVKMLLRKRKERE